MNLYHGGDMTFLNVPIDESLPRCFNDVIRQSDYEEKQKEMDEFNK